MMIRHCQTAVAIVLLAALPCMAETTAIPRGKPDRVLKKGEWEFHIFYRAKGTRSEGQHGVLLHKARKLPPEKQTEEKDTAFGTMIHYGTTYKHPFQITGWNFKDLTKILYSQRGAHPAEQAPSSGPRNPAR